MKILIADDEIRIVDILVKFIESKGLKADQALDGKKALDLLKEQDYDIVFLDVNMPEFTGLEVTRYIKEKKPQTKVIILTGYPNLGKGIAKHVGADEYLEKPVDLKVIGEIIDKYTK